MDWPTKSLPSVTPNKNIFCSSPWYDLHIYWDGSLGFCCQENHKLYGEQDSQWNVKQISIREWYNSEPMRKARSMMFDDQRNSLCRRCYLDEDHGETSRRHKCNLKTVIFTRGNFADSYEQAPAWSKFEHSRTNAGAYDGMPIDLHIDLGNYCNLTCKMCFPRASSAIAAQEVKWGNTSAAQFIGTDWTRNNQVWNRVLDELAGIEKLTNIHFMGGETLITKRFEDFVDYMLARGRTDLNFSFVTNGTVFDQSLLDKLKRFNRVGIEVSIESLTKHNQYQRQGTDTDLVLNNLERYLSQCDQERITVTIRPAVSALTIGSYHTLLRYCLEKQLVIKSSLIFNPAFLDPRILPQKVRDQYIPAYQTLLQEFGLDQLDIDHDYNESDPNLSTLICKRQIIQCLLILQAPQMAHSDRLIADMISWCKKWDRVHGYDARQLYPEWQDLLNEHNY